MLLRICYLVGNLLKVFYRKCEENEKVRDCYRTLKELSLQMKTEDNSRISQLVLLCVILSIFLLILILKTSVFTLRTLSGFIVTVFLCLSILIALYCTTFLCQGSVRQALCTAKVRGHIGPYKNWPEGGKTHNPQLSTLIV